MCDGAIWRDHENNRPGNAVGIAAGRIVFVHQTERANDLGLGIGEDRILYFFDFCEPLQCRNVIISYGRNLVTERSKIFDPAVPDDRLVNAGGSPVE